MAGAKNMKNWKTTNDMSSSERRALQSKLDAMLQDAIADVKALGYSLYDILPAVRITNNKTRLGSAAVANDAHQVKRSCSRRTQTDNVRWTKNPSFRISISTHECSCDKDIKDTLYHEVIHCIPGCFNHGSQFKAAASRVNATYGIDVDTSKKDQEAYAKKNKLAETDLYRLVEDKIGCKVKIRSTEFVFTGFNDRPKRCCDLKSSKGTYICDLYTCAYGLGLVD